MKSSKKATPVQINYKALTPKARKAIERLDNEDSEEEEEASGKIASILTLHTAGVPRNVIIQLGFNKSTVYRQTNDFTRLQKKPALSYFGYDLFETRIQKFMKAKGVSREKAVAALLG